MLDRYDINDGMPVKIVDDGFMEDKQKEYLGKLGVVDDWQADSLHKPHVFFIRFLDGEKVVFSLSKLEKVCKTKSGCPCNKLSCDLM